MWKIKWIAGHLLNRRSHTLLKSKVADPSTFYLQVFLKLISDRPKFVSLQLRSGKKFYAYRFMDLFKLFEIFVIDDYAVDFKDAKLIVDVGSNKGYFSLRMSELFPKAKLYCYEPEPGNFNNLKKLLEENEIQAHLFQEGVSDESGILNLYIDSKNDGGHSIFNEIKKDAKSITVEIVGLDTVMKRLPEGIDVDLMKLDCEGAERDIILKMTQEYAERIHNIFYEATHSLYNPTILNSHLESLGYRISERNGIFKATRGRDVF